jgi:hypothetical protein
MEDKRHGWRSIPSLQVVGASLKPALHETKSVPPATRSIFPSKSFCCESGTHVVDPAHSYYRGIHYRHATNFLNLTNNDEPTEWDPQQPCMDSTQAWFCRDLWVDAARTGCATSAAGGKADPAWVPTTPPVYKSARRAGEPHAAKQGEPHPQASPASGTSTAGSTCGRRRRGRRQRRPDRISMPCLRETHHYLLRLRLVLRA